MQDRVDFSAEGNSTVSLREYGDILRRRRVIILQTFVIVLVAGVLITLFQPLVYQASARLLLEPPQYVLNTVNNDPLADIFKLNNGYTTGTQVEILKSGPIRKRAMEKMSGGKGLTGYSVNVVEGGTSIVELVAEGDDPNAVAQTANNVLQAYIEYTNSNGKSKLEGARQEADRQLNNWLTKRRNAQLALRKYQTDNKIDQIKDEVVSNQKLLSEVTQNYLTQMSQINYLRTRIGEITTFLEKNKNKTTEAIVPNILIDPFYANYQKTIVEKEAQIAALSGDLGSGSDRIISLKAELDLLKQARDQYKKDFDAGRVGVGFNPELKAYKAEANKLKIDLSSLEHSVVPLRSKIDEIRMRLRSVPIFTGMTNDLENTIEQATTQINYFTTTKQNIDLRLTTQVEAQKPIEEAVPPSEPIRPKKPQNIMFSALLGIFLGLCLALLQELLDDRINSPEEAERVLRLPNLGHVPLVEEEGLRLIRDISTFSPLMEAYRGLRTNINFAAVGTDVHSIVVTSSVPAEGKSTTAANLAMAMALDGKRVIIVDADLRRPSLHKLFRIDSSPGLTDVLVGTHEIRDVIRSSSVENVSVIPAGSPPPNPSELLGSSRMSELIEELEKMSDVVLFDSPPTLVVADSVVLASKADGVLLVVGYGETKKSNSRKAIDVLRRANARVLGTVLNRVEGQNSGYYYGKYYVAAAVEGNSKPGAIGETRALNASTDARSEDSVGTGREG